MNLMFSLRSLIGKNLSENEFKEMLNLDDKKFKNTINEKFLFSRNERIEMLDENQARDIEKRIFFNQLT